jgi:hypothetical protein
MKEKQLTYVTLSGGKTGRYVVRKEQKNGTLVLDPDTSARAILERAGARSLTEAERQEFRRTYGSEMLPPDGEG